MNKLLVLIINDMVIFPNNEVRVEYDNIYDRQMIEIVDKIDDDLMLIVNPIDENNIDVTSFPKYGVLALDMIFIFNAYSSNSSFKNESAKTLSAPNSFKINDAS